jgi:hypothetical protein
MLLLQGELLLLLLLLLKVAHCFSALVLLPRSALVGQALNPHVYVCCCCYRC